jgi:diguanylate cyclase
MLPAFPRLPLVQKLWGWRHVARRPEIMAFLPAVTLAAFWFGGEAMLVATALGLPMLFALFGAFRMEEPAADFPDMLGGLSTVPQMERALAEVLRTSPMTGETTGVLVVTVDNLAEIESGFGASAISALQERLGDRI